MVKMKRKPVFLWRISFGEISEINDCQTQRTIKIDKTLIMGNS